MTEPTILFFLSAFLFSAGMLMTIIKKNAIMILLGIELMLNAANLNLVHFHQNKNFEGEFFALFVILIAVCEAAVGIAIILKAYQFYHTSVPDQINQIKEE